MDNENLNNKNMNIDPEKTTQTNEAKENVDFRPEPGESPAEKITFETVVAAAEKKVAEEERRRAEEDAVLEEMQSKAGLEKRLAEAEAAAEQHLAKYKRCLAEFDNFRKRTIKEKSEIYDNGVVATIEKLLPVLDNLERAVESGKASDEGLYKGVQMILTQFKETFASLGVEEIPSVGEKFDPKFHSAVAHIEDPAYGENEIIFDMQKGYKYKNKVIRPSMVKVAN